ncbi:9512_t:CDS:1 [Acaulospora colombiana]|uniref:9512_t:CDS:1 n=1 Tax=Acaulospora colombiana TaxID=27376 RepID=A0ACA9PIZ5_9GLOM|nr:9512_t:CDS:1 [Acaulospora colombiana]
MPVWKLSVHAVQWLRSSAPKDPVRPLTPTRVTVMDKEGNIQTIIPPWEHKFDGEGEGDMQDVKIPEPTYITGLSSPDNTYVNAHPFWQERVQRQAIADDDMAYVVQRYGLNLRAEKLETKQPSARRGSHAKRPSIRELEISRPIPVASTIRRANTLATGQMGAPHRYQHQRGGSIDTYHRHSLQLYSPNAALDVPDDVAPNPFPATRVIHPNPQTRALGLAARTLVGTSRPKATATRAYVDTSKPLPSPPVVIESDESLKSSDPSSLSHNFVMAMAQRVKISASSVKPLIVSTPKATKSPSIYHDDDDEYLE